MRNSTEPPAPGVQIGSRPSEVPVLRLSTDGAPEGERPDLLHQFFGSIGVRYDAMPLSEDPIEIDLTLHMLPGLPMMSGRMQGARFRRTRVMTDITEDVGLLVNSGGQYS